MDEYDEEEGLARKWHWIDLGLVALAVATEWVQSVAEGLDATCHLVAAHSNYKTQQEDFVNMVRSDLESIPTEED